MEMDTSDEPVASTSKAAIEAMRRRATHQDDSHLFKVPQVPSQQTLKNEPSYVPYEFIPVNARDVEEDGDGDPNYEEEDDEGVFEEVVDYKSIHVDGRNKDEVVREEDWEETLVYVELQDILSKKELFSLYPDEFMFPKNTTSRKKNPKETKESVPTIPSIPLNFYNLDSDTPILQIRNKFYLGKYEEPLGTHLFLTEKNPENKEARKHLKSIVKEPDPPLHPVLGPQARCEIEFELIAKVNKVLKMTRLNTIKEKDIPNEPPPEEVPVSQLKISKIVEPKILSEKEAAEFKFKPKINMDEIIAGHLDQIEKKRISSRIKSTQKKQDDEPDTDVEQTSNFEQVILD